MMQPDTQMHEVTTVSAPTTQQVVRRAQVVAPPVETGSPQKAYQTKKAIFRTYQIIWYFLGIIEALLAFRIILKLLGASTQSGFTNFIYAISNPFALPFAGILGVTGISRMVFEWSTIIAMAVYFVLAYGIVTFFQIIKPTDQEEVEQAVDNQ